MTTDQVASREIQAHLAAVASLRPGLLVFLETALAAVLGLLFIGEKSFWLDEGLSYEFAKLDWSDLWQVMGHREANQGLYFVLLRPWLALGESEAAIRSLSVVFAAATIPLLYALGSRLFNAKVGLVAALFMAVNGFYIHYAQEARAYSLLLLLVTASSYLFVTCLEGGSWRRWAVYGLVSAAAVYAQFVAAFVIMAHAAALPLLRRENLAWRSLAASAAWTGLLIAPLGLFVLFRDTGQLDWVAKPSPQAPAVDLTRLAGGYVSALVYIAACAVACLAGLRAWLGSKTSPQTWRYAFLLVWLLAPLATIFLVSQFKPILVTRYLIICLPPLVLLAAAGVCEIGHRFILAAALGLFVVFSLYGVFTWYLKAEKDDWRSATTHVVSLARPGDAVIFYVPGISSPFDYYRTRMGARNDDLVYVDQSSGLPIDSRTPGVFGDFEVSETLTDDLDRQFERVWLVLSFDDLPGAPERAAESLRLQGMLNAHYTLDEAREFEGIKVFLYDIR